MKHILYILLLLAASCLYAQQNAPQQYLDDCPGKLPTSPYYYCQCRNNSRPFAFPMIVEVTDTMWFSATFNDMKQGLCAYWFADCSVTFEVYAFCNSKVSAIKMTIGKNQMREMSIEDIQTKLDQMGEQAEMLGQVLTPRMRVYPNKEAGNTGGTVYCYPYDQGPVSTCDSLLPVIPGMTYVCDQMENVYELDPSRISTKGQGFIRWKQKKNMPGTIRLTTDSCNGPEIANVTLTDSMRVMVLDSAVMKQIKNANKSVFVHVTHDSSYVGRIIYRNTLQWSNQVIDTTICQGKGLQLKDTILTQSTYYGGDTLWIEKDLLSLTGYNLTVTEPEVQYDTLLLRATQLPYNYRNKIIPRDGWGDYDFTIHQADKCDERILVHVVHKIDTIYTVVDDTLCMGKKATYSGVTYTTDTVINDSIWKNADTWEVRDITLHFTEPEIEYDTISVAPSKMTNRGYYYATLNVMVQYGDTFIIKTANNKCTRYIQLHVDQDITIIEGDTMFVLCQGKTLMINNQIYTQDTTLYDTLMVDNDTWQAGTITIIFTAPEIEYDTVIVAPGEMTAGDTLLIITEEGECTRWIQRHIQTTEGWNDIRNEKEKACKYLEKGNLYIRREGIDYDLLGRPINRK